MIGIAADTRTNITGFKNLNKKEHLKMLLGRPVPWH